MGVRVGRMAEISTIVSRLARCGRSGRAEKGRREGKWVEAGAGRATLMAVWVGAWFVGWTRGGDPVQLQEMSWPAVEALSKDIPVVVPIAAMEQHGRHMPVFTDSMLLGEVVRRAADRLGDRVVWAPLLWLGNSHHHLDFPGTLSAAPDRKSTRLHSSHSQISYAVFCLKKN